MRVLGFGLFALSGLLVFSACRSPDDDIAASTDPLTDSDLELAQKAAALLAGEGTGKCTGCHTAGKTDIQRWAANAKTIEAACLAPSPALGPRERVDCLRKDPSNPTSPFAARKLGLLAAGAAHADFEALFKAAYPAAEWQAQYAAFKTKAGMPAFDRPGLNAPELAIVKEWAARGLPKLAEVIPDPAGVGDCVPDTSPELLRHIGEMKTDGWAARLTAASTPMAGCAGTAHGVDCLKTFPDITATWGAEGARQTLRQLRKLNFESDFWVRSSADGRFASFGGSPSRILDLNAPANAAPVTVAAPYDPGYFPNNDGFSFAGAEAGGIRVCRQSVITRAFAGNHKIKLTEPGCTRTIDTVYQSVGAALDGSLFFMATGEHTDDAGGNRGPLSADFGASSTTTLTPMFNDGTKYVSGRDVIVRVPNEGDQQLSPSNRLLITRFGDKAAKAGYRFRRVTAEVSGQDVRVETRAVGTVCLPGGKPQISFDERFMAVHQYMDPAANPAGYAEDSSNIVLVDLRSGKQVAITKMKKGQHALYPHWRADGWLYFLVRDGNTQKETLVASDAALRLSAE